MNLIVFPPKDSIKTSLNKLYNFDVNCDLALVVSYKDLNENIEEEDFISGFKTMKSSLNFHYPTTHK